MFPFGKPYSPPHNALIHQIALLALQPSATRDRLCEGIYLSNDPKHPTGRIEHALALCIKAEAAEKKLCTLIKNNKIQGYTQIECINDALKKKLISKKSANRLYNALEAMRNAIHVDAFDPKML